MVIRNIQIADTDKLIIIFDKAYRQNISYMNAKILIGFVKKFSKNRIISHMTSSKPNLLDTLNPIFKQKSFYIIWILRMPKGIKKTFVPKDVHNCVFWFVRVISLVNTFSKNGKGRINYLCNHFSLKSARPHNNKIFIDISDVFRLPVYKTRRTQNPHAESRLFVNIPIYDTVWEHVLAIGILFEDLFDPFKRFFPIFNIKNSFKHLSKVKLLEWLHTFFDGKIKRKSLTIIIKTYQERAAI